MTIPGQGDDERQDYSKKPEPEDKPRKGWLPAGVHSAWITADGERVPVGRVDISTRTFTIKAGHDTKAGLIPMVELYRGLTLDELNRIADKGYPEESE
jgi:hypothetical protein